MIGSKERCNDEGHEAGFDASAEYKDIFALLWPLLVSEKGIGLVLSIVLCGRSKRISTTSRPSKTRFFAKLYCTLERVIPTYEVTSMFFGSCLVR